MATETAKGEESYGMGYLEERKIVPRWHPALSAFVNFVLAFVIFYVTWFIFFHIDGPMKLYTPMKGFQYIIWFAVIALMWALVFHFWPFHRRWLDRTNGGLKGLALGLASGAIAVFVVHVIFEGWLGYLAITYFSPGALYATGLPGMYSFTVREYSALACLFVGAIFIWTTFMWRGPLEEWPWKGKLKQPGLGFSVFSFGLLVALLFYFSTMHNHMSVLSIPWSSFTGTTPGWWMPFAGTLSGNFWFAFITWAIAVVFTYEFVWEKWPFREIKRGGVRKWGTFWALIALALCIMFGLFFAQELYWGTPIQGARLKMATDWRWLNCAQIGGFWILAQVFWSGFCGNWPHRFSAATNWIARNWIIVGWTVVFHAFYYAVMPGLLGIQKTMFHAQQYPLAPVFWFIVFIILIAFVGDNWPGYKKIKAKEVA